jgi:lipopolysaccharide biosynthesis regulator YciM
VNEVRLRTGQKKRKVRDTCQCPALTVDRNAARIAYLYQQMAIAYGSMGKHNKAHTALKKSHMLNPDDLTVTRMLAKLSEEREEFYDAVQYYEQILE